MVIYDMLALRLPLQKYHTTSHKENFWLVHKTSSNCNGYVICLYLLRENRKPSLRVIHGRKNPTMGDKIRPRSGWSPSSPPLRRISTWSFLPELKQECREDGVNSSGASGCRNTMSTPNHPPIPVNRKQHQPILQ